jgi:DNA-binding IclR family transcriptional regulator
MTLSELAAAAEIPQRTVNKILATLVAHDLLVAGDDGKRYRLGYAWLRIADYRRRKLDVRDSALPAMQRIRDTINETVLLSVRVGDRRIILDCAESTQPIRRIAQSGFEAPLHVGSAGRVLLAGMNDTDIHAYLDRTKLINYGYDTMTDLTRIWDDIRRIRKNSHTVAVNEITEGTASVSAPIKDHNQGTIAVLTITCPKFRFDKSLEKTCIRAITDAAREVSQSFGHIA